MIAIRLRRVLDAYERRTGQRPTYAQLAELTGLSRATIESVASRPYNTTLQTVDKLCSALDCSIGDLLERVGDE